MTMTKPSLLVITLAALFAIGCPMARPRVQISREQAKQLNLTMSGGVATDSAGSIYLTTPSTLVRYESGRNRLEDLLDEPRRDLQDVAVTSEGAVLVLGSQDLCAYVPGHLIRLYRLPDPAFALSCDRQFAYVLTAANPGARLLRITLTGSDKGSSQVLLATEDRPRALCGVRGGCLVASGGNILKITDPEPSTDSASSEVTTVLLVSMQEPITSIAADQDKFIVYFATIDMTYAWIQGQIIPIFPAGSRLALSKDTLTICSPVGQLIQIPGVAKHAQQLLKDLVKNAKRH